MSDKHEYGRLRPPYGGVTNCQATDCGNSELGEPIGAYLHTNLTTGKLVTLCGRCSRQAELTARERLPLVML